jgi:hypothetical protein
VDPGGVVAERSFVRPLLAVTVGAMVGCGWVSSREAGTARTAQVVDTASVEAAAPSAGQVGDIARRRMARAAAREAKREGGAEPGAAAEPGAEELREWMLRSRLPPGAERIDPLWYEAARRHLERLPRYSTVLGRELSGPSPNGDGEATRATWEELGPADIGGRVRALLIDPNDPKVMFAAGVSGGIWKSVDRGVSWRSVGRNLVNLAVTAMAFDPQSSQVIYAGTGEGIVAGPAGVGVYRSGDGGENWVLLNRGQINGRPVPDYVNDLAVSRDGQRLYVASAEGIFRATSTGGSWTVVFSPGTAEGCQDVAIRPDGGVNDYVVASCANRTQGEVLRNVKAQVPGSVWKSVLKESGLGRTTLAFAPSKPNVLYAVASHLREAGVPSQPSNGLHAVYRSDRSGAPGSFVARMRWNAPPADAPLSPFLLSYALLATGSSCDAFLPEEETNLGQGWYANTVAVAPRNPELLVVGGIDLYRSDDGGRSWNIASHWWPHTGNGLPQSPAYAHADQHVVAFDPGFDGTRNRRLFAANDGGVFVTENILAAAGRTRAAGCDPRLTKVVWKSRSRGLAVTQFYTGASFGQGRRFWGGTQDNGTLLGDWTPDRRAWRQILGGDGFWAAVANLGGAEVLLGQDTGNGMLRSLDGGATFEIRGQEIFAAREPGLAYGTPFAVDPSDRRRVWLGTWERPWRSNDAGATWQPAARRNAGPVPVYPHFNALAVSPVDPNRVIGVGWVGDVWSTDQATTAGESTDWQTSKPRLASYLSAVAWDPHAPLVAYLTVSTFGGDHLWRTGDGGVTWAPLGRGSQGLPDVPLLSVVVDPVRGRLYVGTDLGVLVSLDGGATWAVEASGFEPVITPHLTVDRDVNGAWHLVAFTHGRGAWRVRLE